MYKKFILFMVGLIFITSGCSKANESNEYENENIKGVIIRYYSDPDRKLSNKVEIDLTAEGAYVKYSNYYNEIEKEFTVQNIDEIKDFVKENILVSKKTGESRKSNNSDMQKVLWRIRVLTENDSYNYSDNNEYPEYWEELWEVIVSECDAEDVNEFAVEE